MVLVKVTSLKDLRPTALTFYTLLFSLPVFLVPLRGGIDLQMLPDLFTLGCAMGLAVFPSFCSFICMALAIKYIGPTRTAILGSMEPVTALFCGVTCFGETLNLQQLIGVLVILGSVTMVVAANGKTDAK